MVMNDQDHNSTHPLDYAEDGYFGGAEGDDEQSGQMLARIKGLLRGREHWAVILAVILGAAAATAGFFAEPPKYGTEAKFMMKPYIPTVGEGSQRTNIPPMWSEFLNAQQNLLTGPEVKQRAMETDIWREAVSQTGHGGGMGNDLGAHIGRGSYVFTVYNTHENPVIAAASVNALVEAYTEVFAEREEETDSGLLSRLISRRMKLEKEVEQFQERRESVSETMTPSELELTYNTKLNEQNRVSAMLSDAELRLKMLTGAADKDPAEMTNAQIAARFQPVHDLMTAREAAQEELDNHLMMGKGESHLAVKRARKQVDGLDERIDRLCEQYRAGLVDVDSSLSGGESQQIEMLRAQVEQLRDTLDTVQAELGSLTQQATRLATLNEEIEGRTNEIRDIEQRIETIMESRPISGRIEPISTAEAPPAPTNLSKRIQMAVMGLMAGGGLGVGIVLLIGLMDRHLRHAGDAAMGLPDVRMLGMLPTLPEQLDDPQEAEMAANAVHHIRTMLQLGQESGSRVMSVTSASAGSGKSSLTLALGLSFSASGSRTLLIDCDVVGGGLTRRLLGDEAPDRGLLDACAAGPSLGQCVVRANKGMDLLPLGDASPRDAGSLSPRAIRALIEQARRDYDIVIVDTGPVLGSLEASLVAPEVDAVVMIISRGDEKAVVSRSVGHIRSLGGVIAGLVFNHALDTDLTDASYGSFVSQSRAVPGTLRPHAMPNGQTSERFGPLGSAVAAFASSHGKNAEQRNGAA